MSFFSPFSSRQSPHFAWKRSLGVLAFAFAFGQADAVAQQPGPTPSGVTAPAPPTEPAGAPEDETGEEAPLEPAEGKKQLEEAEARNRERLRRIEEVAEKARAVEDLLEGKLNLDIEPSSLFVIEITDDKQAQLEARWLQTLLAPHRNPEGEQEPEKEAPEQSPLGEKPPEAEAKPPEEEPLGGDEGSEEDSQEAKRRNKVELEYVNLQETEPDLYRARLALDRARLRFYSLTPEEKEKILRKHKERQKARDEAPPEEQLNAAEVRERNAEAARLEALEAARKARSEAERLIEEERARLHEVARSQAQFEAQLVEEKQALTKTEDRRLKLRRRVGELLVQAEKPAFEIHEADLLYDELRAALGESRDALAESLRQLNQTDEAVPRAGEDPLADLTTDLDTTRVKKTRSEVDATAGRLEQRLTDALAEAAASHYADMEALDDLRLRLVPHLSDTKRKTVTGLGPGGLEQAFAEARHVMLVLRYHHSATSRWLHAVTEPTATRGKSAIAATLIAIKWVFPIGVFVWWRRRAAKVLDTAEAKVRDEARVNTVAGSAHPLLRGIALLRRIRRPLEWLLLVWAIVWFLPPEAQMLLEVQLTSTVFTWTLGGTIAVTAIDFLADLGPRHRRKSALLTAHLRLRSLRLVGRAVVVFGLILGLTNQLVGKGTIYSWVFSLLFMAAALIFLLLVKWWRQVIFERVARKRKKSRLDSWVEGHQTGWRSFIAALLGGTALFTAGGYRALRTRVNAFSVTRRVLAYLFQRDMSKQAEDVPKDDCLPLDKERFRLLSPLKHSDEVVPSVADTQLDEVIKRINAPGGGVFAIVGERGSGKTTLLRRIAERADDIVHVKTPFGEMVEFEEDFLRALRKKDMSIEQAALEFDGTKRDAGILIDNAHRLIQPMVGGFESFDRVLTLARTCSKNIAWVFAFDEVIWRLLQRMRGTKPLFDDVIRIEPWREDGIVSLLTSRNKKAGITPRFDALVSDLPEDADHIDFEEALAQTEENYLRLLWHYSSGNPGLALHAWRMSLGIAPAGDIQVRVFKSPSPAALEGLPDNALFVLRAIVQLERAALSQICQVTHLPLSTVQDVVRYGRVKGYIHESEDGIGITWTWFRAVTKLLQRRHLLYSA